MDNFMSTTPAVQSDGVRNSSLRSPLRPISPPSQKQILRRKSSFILRGDSSEDCPSSQDSIFEAFYCSAANSEESSHKIDLNSISPPQQHNSGGANASTGTNENNRQLTAPSGTISVEDVEFRYGRGTILETITEQKSSNTMRTLARARSADDFPKILFLNHCDSFEVAKSPRRKQSFSVDDLALIQQNYHEACAMIERETRKALPVHEIYAQPKDPIHPPVHRPPTPPGMPSWTAAQNLPRPTRGSNNTTGVQNRLQRFLNLPASGTAFSSRVPTRTVSAPLPSQIAPRFRPPRSVYGPIDRHPFITAPVAKVINMPPSVSVPPTAPSSSGTQMGIRLPKPTGKRKLGKRVRFTPSATARDSEMVSLQTAVMTTITSAMHPLAPAQVTPDIAHGLPNSRCPHGKGRRDALKRLRNSLNLDTTTPPNNEYLPLSDQSPPRSTSTLVSQTPTPILSPSIPAWLPSSRHASINTVSTIFDSQPSRATSYSSTAHLMSGISRSSAPTPSSPVPIGTGNKTSPKESWCWKCSVEKGINKIDHWWMQSANCMCIVCFGVDIDDDMSLHHSDSAAHSSHRDMPGGIFGQEIVGPRRVVLEQTPGITP
jgi:hypothetical protein